MKAVVRMHADGRLQPTVGGVFPADEIARAHDFVSARESIGKVAISWRPDR